MAKPLKKPTDIIILGAGGNSIAIADAILAINSTSPHEPRYRLRGFLDDLPQNKGGILMGHRILGEIQDAPKWADCKFINGVGSVSSFRKKNELIRRSGIDTANFETIIHPTAVIAPDVILGKGCAVMANSVLCTQSKLDNHVLILQSTTINHHSRLRDNVILSAGITVLGFVDIEESAFIGGGATIAPHIRIGREALIGMGSAVIRDVAAGTVVAGNPARKLPASKYALATGEH